jgi:CRP-like cAMP-binding protein
VLDFLSKVLILCCFRVGNDAEALKLSWIRRPHVTLPRQAEYWEDVFHRADFSVSLRKRIRSYHEYLLQNRVSKLPDWAQSTLSKDLLRDVTAHIYSETISSLPMFKSMPAAARTELALELEHVQVPTGEILYEEGVPGDRMYFLRKGTVQMSILLMTEQQKSAFGPTRIHEAIETQIVNRIHKGKFGFHIDGQRECAYSWNVSQHTCSYFGESVLFSESDSHLSSSVALTPCTFFVLTRSAMERVAEKFPGVAKVKKQLQAQRKRHLRPIIQKIIQAHRARIRSQVTQVRVTIHAALNMPKMDAFTGRCDPYCEVRLGDANDDPHDADAWHDNASHSTLVCYNTYTPTWNQIFVYPIKRNPRAGEAFDLKVNVWDWDLVGQHDFIGTATHDIAGLLQEAVDDNEEKTRGNIWLPIFLDRGGKKQVKGRTGKSLLRISLHIVPPHHHHGVTRKKTTYRASKASTSAGGDRGATFPSVQDQIVLPLWFCTLRLNFDPFCTFSHRYRKPPPVSLFRSLEHLVAHVRSGATESPLPIPLIRVRDLPFQRPVFRLLLTKHNTGRARRSASERSLLRPTLPCKRRRWLRHRLPQHCQPSRKSGSSQSGSCLCESAWRCADQPATPAAVPRSARRPHPLTARRNRRPRGRASTTRTRTARSRETTSAPQRPTRCRSR